VGFFNGFSRASMAVESRLICPTISSA